MTSDGARPPRRQLSTSPAGKLSVLREPSGDEGVVIVTHPGAIVAGCYGPVSAELDPFGFAVLEIDSVPEYRESMMGGQPLAITIEEVSRRFADATADLARDRPVVLLGWSFGGVLAYGLAQELAKTISVDHLVLLDSIAPGPGDPGKKFGNHLPDREALDWFAMYFGAKRAHPLNFLPSDFADDDVDSGLDKILRRCQEHGTVTTDTSVSGLKKVFGAFVDGILRNKQLHDGFDPAAPRWPVSLVRPERGLFEAASVLGWGDVVGDDIPLHRCDGDHYTMLTDPQLAAALGKLIAEVVQPTKTHQPALEGNLP